jgi:hypothetical protein
LELQAFLDKVKLRELPKHPMARIRTLAKEMAEGAAENLWGVELGVFHFPEYDDEQGKVYLPNSTNMQEYLLVRWGSFREYPSIVLLGQNGYVTIDRNYFTLTKAAFDLIDVVEPATIFISYKRSESSALALLVLARLKQAGLNAFVDLSLVPGANWRTELKERIQKSDYLIALLGKETLKSDVVETEILWAMDAKTKIIPIWHGGFKASGEMTETTGEIAKLLQETHTIRVLEESALGYNNAMVELLNMFGVTP